MKKSILLFVAVVGLLVSCDPVKDDKGFDVTNITADQLLANSTFSQYSDEACTIEAADGNYIKFNCPNVSALTIFYLKPDGSEGTLSTGKSGGVFNFVPMRGSDPNQTIYFRYINQNGEEVVASRDFTVQVAADLSTEVKLLVSDSGTKVWKWNTNAPDGQYWGNLGGAGDDFSGEAFALTGSGKWWGVDNGNNGDLSGQVGHTGSDGLKGDESMDATMVMSEDGTVVCYDKDGNVIRSGSFEVQNYDPTYSNSKKYCGILHTAESAILFPYEINSGGRKVTDFQIAYLSPSRLVLIYPDGGDWATAQWGEGTFWQFYSDTDVAGCLSDNASASWTWDDDNGQCWGNCGYGGLVYGGYASITGGSWWGIPSSGIEEQITSYGYGMADVSGATMTFTSDGLLTKSSGGSGSYSYDVNNKTDIGGYEEGQTWGRLNTTGDGILFPVRINKGIVVNEFDLVYFDDDHLVLAYPNNLAAEEGASWMEGTFWRFKKVK